MPIYCYRLPDGRVVEVLKDLRPGPPERIRVDPETGQEIEDEAAGVWANRCLSAEATRSRPKFRGGYPRRSSSMGVNPKQIPDIVRRFPDEEGLYHPRTGDAYFRSYEERKRVMSRHGMVDMNAYY